MTERMELYKAAKYEVETVYEDHGMSLPEMWEAVNDPNDSFWKEMCLDDYRSREQ